MNKTINWKNSNNRKKRKKILTIKKMKNQKMMIMVMKISETGIKINKSLNKIVKNQKKVKKV